MHIPITLTKHSCMIILQLKDTRVCGPTETIAVAQDQVYVKGHIRAKPMIPAIDEVVTRWPGCQSRLWPLGVSIKLFTCSWSSSRNQ